MKENNVVYIAQKPEAKDRFVEQEKTKRVHGIMTECLLLPLEAVALIFGVVTAISNMMFQVLRAGIHYVRENYK